MLAPSSLNTAAQLAGLVCSEQHFDLLIGEFIVYLCHDETLSGPSYTIGYVHFWTAIGLLFKFGRQYIKSLLTGQNKLLNYYYVISYIVIYCIDFYERPKTKYRIPSR